MYIYIYIYDKFNCSHNSLANVSIRREFRSHKFMFILSLNFIFLIFYIV